MEPATLAEGIAIYRPPRARQILAAVRESGGTFLTVPEDGVREAQRDLAARGLLVEATGVACWAAVRAGGDAVRGEVVVPLCGSGVKDRHGGVGLGRGGAGVGATAAVFPRRGRRLPASGPPTTTSGR
ncbi:hypothetical protein SCALM49S_03336 [Streptomyces californicus]